MSERGATFLSGILLLSGFILGWIEENAFLRTPLFALSLVAGGWHIAPKGWKALRRRALDMNFLMTIAGAGATLIGEWAEAAATMFLFSLAEMLESASMERARHAIGALMELSPSVATVRRQGQEETVPVEKVDLGEILIVRPGEKIPLDGEVLRGRSAVNEAPITGESMPVEKEVGSEIFAGSINEQGLLEVRATKLVQDTTLSRIIHAVQEAQKTRAPAQSFVDRFSRLYTPCVVFLAIFVFLMPPLADLGSWSTWFYRALMLLVIACPCALVISTPVSVISGVTGAARSGVLIKGGVYLENAGALTVVAFDKTGTLTEGRPSVVEILPATGRTPEEVLQLAASVEYGSEHPLGRAVIQKAQEETIERHPAEDFEALFGRGARAKVDGRWIYVGSERLAAEVIDSIDSLRPELERLEAEGKTGILVIEDSEIAGVIGIADAIRPAAHTAIAALRKRGLRTWMLTGDNEATARAVAATLEIDEYRARLLPDEKVETIRQLESAGEKVGFVGDGVNDAPALAAASIGFAMGAAGTDVALETADIALMADDLSKVPLAVSLSRKTLRIIRQNIAVAILIKPIFIILALAGWATLWMAVAADMGASLVVIANGMRARRADRA